MSLKVYYYNFRGRAEPIRALLWLANAPYEDVRLTTEELEKLKVSGKFEFGKVPAIELPDG